MAYEIVSSSKVNFVAEKQWIRKAKNGDLKAYNNLVLANQDLIFEFLVRILGELCIAEDSTQKVFLKAFSEIGSFRESSFKLWIMRIALDENRILLARQNKHSYESSNYSYSYIKSKRMNLQLPSNDLPGQYKERFQHSDDCLQSRLDILPPQLRILIVLVDLLGFGYRDSAYISRIDEDTLKMHLASARQYLINGFSEPFIHFLGVPSSLPIDD